MQITILSESGHREALLGLSLNKNQPVEKMTTVAARLAPMDGGHNKFLESIVVWLDIRAPRYWWQEFDTYRVGISKQSQSTMHTALKTPLTQADFIGFVPDLYLDYLNQVRESGDIERLKELLPEGFWQRRVVCANYKALRHIVSQRKNHRLPLWQTFCAYLVDHLEHGECLV